MIKTVFYKSLWFQAFILSSISGFANAAKLPTAGSGIQSSADGALGPLDWILAFLKDYGGVILIGIVVIAFIVYGWQLVKIFGSNDKNKWEEFGKVFLIGLIMLAIVATAAIYANSLIA